LAVASMMAALALHGGWQVLRQARGELGEQKIKAHDQELRNHDHDHAH
jgi:hypothetical protein